MKFLTKIRQFLVIIKLVLYLLEYFVSFKSFLTKKLGIIPVVLEPYFIAVSDTDPIIPFSPPPKIISKLCFYKN